MSNTKLSDQQEKAYKAISDFLDDGGKSGSMMLLGGYAGTGKTYLVSKIIDEFSRKKKRIALSAPTNKAVRVLKEKMEAFPSSGSITYASIHKILGQRVIERADGTYDCRPERDPEISSFDIVVIDEASMIDRALLDSIVLHQGNALVLFVGDPAQLPPVQEESALSPVFKLEIPRAVLTKIVRQAEGNAIIELSLSIREHIRRNDPLQESHVLDIVRKTSSSNISAMRETPDKLVSAVSEFQSKGLDVRILAYRNKTVEFYNRRIQSILYPGTTSPFVPGQKAIVQEERSLSEDDSSGRLMTSEEVLVEDCLSVDHPKFPHIRAWKTTLRRDDKKKIQFFVPDNVHEWRKTWQDLFEQRKNLLASGQKVKAKNLEEMAWKIRKSFLELRPVYSMTLHKSQGSTFHSVYIDWNDILRIQSVRNNKEFMRAIYVAVTRPSERVVFFFSR